MEGEAPAEPGVRSPVGVTVFPAAEDIRPSMSQMSNRAAAFFTVGFAERSFPDELKPV